MHTTHPGIVQALPYVLAYPALLVGHQTVDEAMNDQLLSHYLSAFIDQDESTDYLSAAETDLDGGSFPLLRRFFDPVGSDPLAHLCADGAFRLPAYILPALLDLLARNSDVQRMAFLLATYGHYLSGHHPEASATATTGTLRADDRAKINSDDAVALLGVSSVATARLQTYTHFVAMYKSYRTQIATYGVEFLLRQMAYNRLAMPTA